MRTSSENSFEDMQTWLIHFPHFFNASNSFDFAINAAIVNHKRITSFHLIWLRIVSGVLHKMKLTLLILLTGFSALIASQEDFGTICKFNGYVFFQYVFHLMVFFIIKLNISTLNQVYPPQISHGGFIVGGWNAEDGQAPFQCSMQYKKQHFCGCAILSSKWLITASHCFFG